MRKIILYFQMSIDGVVSESDQWMLFSDDILKDALDYYQSIDTVIFGSNTYPFMSRYWPEAAQSSDSPLEKKFAKEINNVNKIVISRSEVELTWKNSHHLKFTDNESLAMQIGELKNKPGKNISVEGGIKTWELFLQNNLFDEILIFVHPVVVGRGIMLFENANVKSLLDLKSTVTLERGVVKLWYERK